MPVGTLPLGFKNIGNAGPWRTRWLCLRARPGRLCLRALNGMDIGNGPLWTRWLCLWARPGWLRLRALNGMDIGNGPWWTRWLCLRARPGWLHLRALKGINISNGRLGRMVIPLGLKWNEHQQWDYGYAFGQDGYAFWHDEHAFGFYWMDIGSGPVGTMVMPAGFKMEQTSVMGSEYNGYAVW